MPRDHVHSIRRTLAVTCGLALAALSSAALAQDGATDVFRSEAAPVRLAPKRTAHAWRTIVIPAPQDDASKAAAAGQKSAAHQPHRPPPTTPQSRPLTGYAHELGGLASYYWQEQMTSSGERFDRRGMTAAHKTLPIGTRVRVTNLANGKSTIVRINDRGPFKAGRVIDLSEAAAEQISMTGHGLARVAIEVVH